MTCFLRLLFKHRRNFLCLQKIRLWKKKVVHTESVLFLGLEIKMPKPYVLPKSNARTDRTSPGFVVGGNLMSNCLFVFRFFVKTLQGMTLSLESSDLGFVVLVAQSQSEIDLAISSLLILGISFRIPCTFQWVRAFHWRPFLRSGRNFFLSFSIRSSKTFLRCRSSIYLLIAKRMQNMFAGSISLLMESVHALR